jgi:hypothetical protein
MTDSHTFAHGGQGAALGVMIFTSLLLAASWGCLQSALNLTIPWWIDTPSVLGFYGLVYWFYDRWAWRWLIGVHGIPDIAGNYSVKIRSSHDKHATEYEARITVWQSWSRILVRLEASGSISVSRGGYLVEVPGNGHRLVYLYHNTPRPSAVSSMQQHDGTGEIDFAADGQTAVGGYYSGRGRLQHGEMSLTRVYSHGPTDRSSPGPK